MRVSRAFSGLRRGRFQRAVKCTLKTPAAVAMRFDKSRNVTRQKQPVRFLAPGGRYLGGVGQFLTPPRFQGPAA